MTNKQYFTTEEVIERALEWLHGEIKYGELELNSLGDEINESDLHHSICNNDYYIVGTYEAKKALEQYDVFEAIEEVQNYENEISGFVTTDFSNAEAVASALWCSIGEEVINAMEFYSYDTVQDVINYLESRLQ